MTIEQAALAALYPVLVILCVIGVIRFYPARKNMAGATRTLTNGVLVIIGTLAVESMYYGVTRFQPTFYNVFGANVWLVGTMKIGYIAGISLLLRAYWEITDSRPGLWAPMLTAVAMWMVLTLFVVLS